MAPEVKIRAFLALPVGSLFLNDLTSLIEKFRPEYPEVRWVRPSDAHMTLHFFGPITTEEVSKISGRTTSAAQGVKPFEIFLEGMGGFPNLKRPRVIWVGIGGEVEFLKSFHRSLEEALRKEGFPTEERLFKPHLTIGRVKESRDFSGMTDLRFGPTPKQHATEVILFQSHLMPQGARYEAIARYPLLGT